MSVSRGPGLVGGEQRRGPLQTVPSANGAALDEANRFLFITESIVVTLQPVSSAIDNAFVVIPFQILRKLLSAFLPSHMVQRQDSQIAEHTLAGREVAARILAALKTPF
jgi:hypothetical protein